MKMHEKASQRLQRHNIKRLFVPYKKQSLPFPSNVSELVGLMLAISYTNSNKTLTGTYSLLQIEFKNITTIAAELFHSSTLLLNLVKAHVLFIKKTLENCYKLTGTYDSFLCEERQTCFIRSGAIIPENHVII